MFWTETHNQYDVSPRGQTIGNWAPTLCPKSKETKVSKERETKQAQRAQFLVLSPRAKYYFSCFSITKWTETGGDEYEYEVELSRIKGGEGGSKRIVVAIERGCWGGIGCQRQLSTNNELPLSSGPAVLAAGQLGRTSGTLLREFSGAPGKPNSEEVCRNRRQSSEGIQVSPPRLVPDARDSQLRTQKN